MVHNGIEYGLMAALRRGTEHPQQGQHRQDPASRPTRRRRRCATPSTTSTTSTCADITELWRRGSVVASWLLDLTAQAFLASPGLENFAGRVSDSGEGRWTLAAANDEAVPAHVLSAALFERFASRGEDDFQNRVLSAMRFGFGGHLEKKAG